MIIIEFMANCPVGTKVHWNDPDGELSSGEYEVIENGKEEFDKLSPEEQENAEDWMIVINNGFSESEVYAYELELIKNGNKMNKQIYVRLLAHEVMIQENLKKLITGLVKENNGRITFTPEPEDEDCFDYYGDFPIVLTLNGNKGGTYTIAITDVYLDENGQIMVDGFDIETDEKLEEFYPAPEQYSDIMFVIADVLGWNASYAEIYSEASEMNSEILEMASELAEKELVDALGLLPSQMVGDKEEGTYTEEIQDKFNGLYDKYEDKICQLTGFDYDFLTQKYQ